MSIKEFREAGYLQEINRLVLHPCGLALEVTLETDDEGKMTDANSCIMRVWDYRNDPEGIIFARNPTKEKAMNVVSERKKHYPERYDLFEHLDHTSESYSAHILNIENYRKGDDVNATFCHPPDVQPITDEQIVPPSSEHQPD
jgi:hypothetical protein